MERELERTVTILGGARSVLFITGAGISAESGLPTYRGIGGLYNVENAEGDMPIEEVLSGPTFRRRPELTWKHLHRLENACRGARFNRAHEILALMESCFERCWVLTQNVDGFHRASWTCGWPWARSPRVKRCGPHVTGGATPETPSLGYDVPRSYT